MSQHLERRGFGRETPPDMLPLEARAKEEAAKRAAKKQEKRVRSAAE